MHRWKMIELETISDRDFVLQTLFDRRDRCTDPYAPLYVYITKLIGRIEKEGC